MERAPVVTLRRLADGVTEAVLHEDEGATAQALGLPVPELTTIQNRDGVPLIRRSLRDGGRAGGPGAPPPGRLRLRRPACPERGQPAGS